MTAPAPAIADALEALYGMSAATLSLDARAYARRIALWEQQAATLTTDSRLASVQVRILALRAWQASLMTQADKFRAEGDITVEKDIMARIALVNGWLKEAQGELPNTTGRARRSANPAPELQGWGLG